jgi:TPR repeat protein
MKKLFSTLLALSALVAHAQTAASDQSQKLPQPHVVQQEDYIALRIASNKLTTKEVDSLRAQATAGAIQPELLLGMAYQMGSPAVPEDSEEAEKWYRMAANQGSSIGANQAAVLYDPFEGSGRDPEEALKWYRRAAERGDDAVAQFNVCALLRQLKRDYEAADWCRKSAENGAPGAAGMLASLYDDGKVLAGKSKHENWKEGLAYLQRLAGEGNAGAQFAMGKLLFYGWLGSPRDPKAAVEWFRKAAEQRMAVAELLMGELYLYGRSVPKDNGEAVKWYLKAADQEEPNAQLRLALIYDKGVDGVPPDAAAAYLWYSLAEWFGAPGTKVPKNAIEAGSWIRLRHPYTDAEFEEGEKRLRAWKMEHGRMEEPGQEHRASILHLRRR